MIVRHMSNTSFLFAASLGSSLWSSAAWSGAAVGGIPAAGGLAGEDAGVSACTAATPMKAMMAQQTIPVLGVTVPSPPVNDAAPNPATGHRRCARLYHRR